MSGKRILTVQDLSCMGQCSLMAAVPILSACGFETCVLPTALLSNHTDAGFHGFTFRDLTGEMPGILRKWQRDENRFDALYTGYLGNAEQVGIVRNLVFPMVKKGGIKIVDPAMADNGALYTGFGRSFVRKMAELCAAADIILPNLTEACLLAGKPFLPAVQTEEEIRELAEQLAATGPETVVLTGVSLEEGKIGNAVLDRKTARSQYSFTERVPRAYPGTGDCFAAAFAGALLHGFVPAAAARTAAEFVLESLLQTAEDPEHWYGVNFERALPYLVRRVNGARPLSRAAKRAEGIRRRFLIDGSSFQNREEFFQEMTRVFTAGAGSEESEEGRLASVPAITNLDSLHDALRGGFGRHGFGEPVEILWTHFEESRKALGESFLLTVVGILLSREEEKDCILRIENEA